MLLVQNAISAKCYQFEMLLVQNAISAKCYQCETLLIRIINGDAISANKYEMASLV